LTESPRNGHIYLILLRISIPQLESKDKGNAHKVLKMSNRIRYLSFFVQRMERKSKADLLIIDNFNQQNTITDVAEGI
jgi:hypothetical protein